MNGTPHNLNFNAKCLLKTKIRLNQRSFSNFTIDELNDCAGCIYDLAAKFHMTFTEFYLNRLTKEFRYRVIVDIKTHSLKNGDLDNWMLYTSFLKYLFNVDGSSWFEHYSCVLKEKLSKSEKEQFNKFADEFCNKIWFDLWNVFSQYNTVKQNVLEYFTNIGIIKRRFWNTKK